MPQQTTTGLAAVPSFERSALRHAPDAARPERIDTLMLNVGLRCNSACPHCHHSCTPQRTEVMSRETMFQAIQFAQQVRPSLVDITGGEPELFEQLPELLTRLSEAGLTVRVRTNLFALGRTTNPDLVPLLARHRIQVLASIPDTVASNASGRDIANGWGATLPVLKILATLGYGEREGASSRRLDLAYNPPLGQMPRPQKELETEFRTALAPHGVRFDSLLAIANMPIGRYRRQLESRGAYADHLAELAAAFNPKVLGALQCRHGLEIAWDGTFWDCDFNLAAGVRPAAGPFTVAEALKNPDALGVRRIGFGPHCYACTVGAGSG